MNMVIKTKFKCKSGSRTSNKHPIKWVDRFIEEKWYDGEYETWSFEQGYDVNGGWRRYWVISEQGIKEEIPRAHMRIIFETNLDSIRDAKIDMIINDQNEASNQDPLQLVV